MRDLDPALIEAVALGLNAEEACWSGVNLWTNDEHGITQETKDEYRRLAVAAIRAVDAYRAASVRAAVGKFESAALGFSITNSAPIDEFKRKEAIVEETRAALLALVNAEETE